MAMIRVLRRKLRTWAAQPRRVRSELPLALCTLVIAQPMLKFCGLRVTQRWLDRGAGLAGKLRFGRRRRSEWSAEDSAQAVKVAADALPGFRRCLTRSLATRFLLLRRGIESELLLGARRAGGELDAHAWLQVDGEPLGEQPGADMKAFERSRPVGTERA